MSIVEKFNHIDHASLRNMEETELSALCKEIRELLLSSVSVTGGHLASNLGVVELTVALHRAFESPHDKLVWDVGHQCYVHKILTGRADKMDSLRQFGGLSGFPKRAESSHDVFETGHSSTSLSAAIGLACAREQRGETGQVVAIIGDGALTGGMAYEALNQIGSAKTPMVIVLNDNEMAISPNVGALHFHLTKFRISRRYMSFKRLIARRFPRIKRVLERIKNSFKYLFFSSAFFEELGIKYIGPIDGHDIVAMEEVFARVKHMDIPVVVHVLTTKGKGFEPAESHPERFHGISGSEKVRGKSDGMTVGGESARNDEAPLVAPVSNSTVFAETLCSCAEKDARVVAITAAMADGTGLNLFEKRFPERFYDVGIAEQHALTFAAGLAAGGMRPVVALYSTFLQRGYDQLLHDICLQKLPVVVGVDRCGPVGQDGPTHHGVYDIAFLTQMPNLTVFSPSTQEELRRSLEAAFSIDGPVAIRYPRNSLPVGDPIKSGEDLLSWERTGDWRRTILIATGQMVEIAKNTGRLLKEKGYPSTIINARCLSPMDLGKLEEIGLYAKHIIVLEDGVKSGGLGDHIANFYFGGRNSAASFSAFAMPDEPMPQGELAELFHFAGLTPQQLCKSILSEIEDTNERKKQA